MKKIICLFMCLITVFMLFTVTTSAVSEFDISKAEETPIYYGLVGVARHNIHEEGSIVQDIYNSKDYFVYPLVFGLDSVNAFKFSQIGITDPADNNICYFDIYLPDGWHINLTFNYLNDEHVNQKLIISLVGPENQMSMLFTTGTFTNAVDGYLYIDTETSRIGCAYINDEGNVIYNELFGENSSRRIVTNVYPYHDISHEFENVYFPPITILTPMEDGIMSTFIHSATDFVGGIGKTFLKAFQTVFMNKVTVDGVVTYIGLNALGIFLICFAGIALGYGVIRWITGLFRRESN